MGLLQQVVQDLVQDSVQPVQCLGQQPVQVPAQLLVFRPRDSEPESLHWVQKRFQTHRRREMKNQRLKPRQCLEPQHPQPGYLQELSTKQPGKPAYLGYRNPRVRRLMRTNSPLHRRPPPDA